MKPLFIVLIVLVGIGGWLLWFTAKPHVRAMLSEAEWQQLERAMPRALEGGNRVDTYTSFADMWGDLQADLRGAQHHVHMQFFKFESDSVGRELGDILIQKAAEGVEARLLYDSFMCRTWASYYRKLRRQGVQTAGYAKMHWPFLQRRDYYRNHRKVVLVDGRVAYIGGINIAERYLHGLKWGCWRDTMVRLEGPVVAEVQRAFAADWCYATGQMLTHCTYFPPQAPVGNLAARIITSGPVGCGLVLMQHTCALLDRSQRYVYFESPYFIPPAEVMQSLCQAARRGVDVRVLLPPRGDRGEITQWASKYHFAEALVAGVKIGLYQKGYMHSKLIVADDRVAVVGSCNIDPRSYLYCQEIAVEVDSAAYARQLRSVYEADEAQSVRIAPDEWAQRGCGERWKERLAHLVDTQL